MVCGLDVEGVQVRRGSHVAGILHCWDMNHRASQIALSVSEFVDDPLLEE